MPKVQLNVTHTHAGVTYPAGHVLDVDEHTARWLIERGICARVVSTPNPVLDGALDIPQAASVKRVRATNERNVK